MTTRNPTAGAARAMTEGQSQDANYGVAMGYDIHLIRTGVMTPRCRYDGVTLSSGQHAASRIRNRPHRGTGNRQAGQPTVATVARCCPVPTIAPRATETQARRAAVSRSGRP